jgi:hypothetical protein
VEEAQPEQRGRRDNELAVCVARCVPRLRGRARAVAGARARRRQRRGVAQHLARELQAHRAAALRGARLVLHSGQPLSRAA